MTHHQPNTTQHTKIHAALIQNSWFKSLPDDLAQKLIQSGSIQHFSDTQVIHYQGDAPHALYAVLSGSVKVSSTSSEGRECVFRYLSPANWFGEIGMLDHATRTHDARAVKQTRLLVINQQQLNQILNQHPVFYKYLSLLLCRVVRNSFIMLDDSALLSVSARLAKRLMSFANFYGEPTTKGIMIRLRLTQDELAMLINTTRQTINKRLVDWQKLGWIESKYARIIISNPEALKQIYQDE